MQRHLKNRFFKLQAQTLASALVVSSLALALVFAPFSIDQILAQTTTTETTPQEPEPQANEATRDAVRELDQVSQALNLTEERAQFLRQEIEAMAGDRSQQNAALIAAAQRVKLSEIEATDAEERLTILLNQEQDIRTRLDGADIEIAVLLSALQRIGKNPPPALIIDPQDAINAARTASLLSAVLPQLNARADIVTTDLRALVSVRESVETEKNTLSSRLLTLQEEQLRIATLIEARRVGVSRANSELAEQEDVAEELASEATSLDQLITALREKIEAVDNAVEAANSLNAPDQVSQLSIEAVQAALLDNERTTPAFSISSARGFLTAPAAGVVVTQFGADDGFGGIAKGVFLVTRAEAQVITPSDGWVIYKGPYLNYGEIIILNPGEEHLILLAGLENVTVDLGQFVRMGEPVGSMGARTIGQTITTRAGIARPTLYIEFRNSNVPFDPIPFWTEPRIAQTSQ